MPAAVALFLSLSLSSSEDAVRPVGARTFLQCGEPRGRSCADSAAEPALRSVCSPFPARGEPERIGFLRAAREKLLLFSRNFLFVFSRLYLKKKDILKNKKKVAVGSCAQHGAQDPSSQPGAQPQTLCHCSRPGQLHRQPRRLRWVDRACGSYFFFFFFAERSQRLGFGNLKIWKIEVQLQSSSSFR
jgi:hypothetical protein